MPMYTLRWSEERQITKEFESTKAAFDWWHMADSGEVEDELDYSDCGDLKIALADKLPAAILECDCPICAVLRAEMVDERTIAVYHLSDPSDHPEMDEAEFKELINQELDHIFGADECPDCIMGKCPEHGIEDDLVDVFPLGLHAGDVITIGLSEPDDLVAGTIVEIEYLDGESGKIEAANIVLANGWKGIVRLEEIS